MRPLRPPTQPPHLARFAAWLAAFGDAWEGGDADALSGLFVLEATWQETPFAEPLRGRRAIRDHWQPVFAQQQGVQFRAQVLGVGDTYGVAHWRVTCQSPADPKRTIVVDGMLIVALDPRGRCTSMRRWSHQGEHFSAD